MLEWNLPVDPGELQFALQIGNAAGSLQMPIDNPETKGFDLIDDESGEIQEIRLKDNAMNRFGSAVVQEFGKDESRFYSIMTRIFALIRLTSDDERAKKYLKEDPEDQGNIMINNALIDVMAKFPIRGDGEFDKDAFFTEVQALIENEKR